MGKEDRLNLDIFEVAYLRGLLQNRVEELPTDSMAKALIEKLKEAYPDVAHVIGTTSTQRHEKPCNSCLNVKRSGSSGLLLIAKDPNKCASCEAITDWLRGAGEK